MYGTVTGSGSRGSSRKLDAAMAPPPTVPSPFRYEVQDGDTLASIAAKTSTTEAQLCALNPMLVGAGDSHKKKHRVKVYPGQQLIVEEAQQVSLPPPPECIDNGWGQMHVVRAGETLKDIAAQYNTTEELLRQDNRQFFPAGERGALFPGQLLHVRIVNTGGDMDELRADAVDGEIVNGVTYASPSSSATYSKYKTHLIEPSDTFESICKAYCITYARLLQINRGRYPVGARAVLTIGERLIVPDLYASQMEASRRNVAEVKLTKQIHIVEDGETPESIAAAYNMTYEELREFNRAYFPKGYRGEIRVGYKLVVKRQVDKDEYVLIGGDRDDRP
ncbi:Peptidoglycan-binding protein, partial [Globisporangium splendens]